MENKMTLKITKDEIYFNCEGYSEEFINSISEAISNARGRFSENRGYADIERRAPKKEIEAKTTDAAGIKTAPRAKKEICTSKRNSKRRVKIYAPGEKEEMSKAIKADASLQEIQEKYGISTTTYYRRRAKCGAVNPSAAEKANAKSSLSASETNNLIRDIKAGMKFKEAAEKYGITGIAFARCSRIAKRYKNKPELKENDKNSSNSANKPLVPIDISSMLAGAEKGTLLSGNPKMARWQLQQMAKGN